MRKTRRKGLLIINTGDGKGKTSAALGVLFRAWGREMKVCMLQFIKRSTARYGEHRAARKIGVELEPMGDGFTWLSKDLEATRRLAVEQWWHCRTKISCGEYDLVILDELTYPVHYGWIPLREVLEVLRARPAELHVIVTGRNAPPELVELADLVTEMKEIKHPYRQGIKAQKGIDF